MKTFTTANLKKASETLANMRCERLRNEPMKTKRRIKFCGVKGSMLHVNVDTIKNEIVNAFVVEPEKVEVTKISRISLRNFKKPELVINIFN